MTDALVCLCTCPSDEVATRLAHALVDAEVAACVNVVPGVRSIYRWEGKVTEDAEVLLVIKTTRAAFPSLESALRAQHPYTVPELVALPLAGGSAPYLAWMAGAVRSL